MNTPAWFKSTFSENANQCVEVRIGHDTVSIRDSKNPRGPVITITADQWAALLAELTGHAPTGSNGAVTVHTTPAGAILRAADGTTLSYTPGEWRAYLAGVRADEFAVPAH